MMTMAGRRKTWEKKKKKEKEILVVVRSAPLWSPVSLRQLGLGLFSFQKNL
jgi:hypothetical protein